MIIHTPKSKLFKQRVDTVALDFCASVCSNFVFENVQLSMLEK
jgi:hypothetical protein